ncbi:uncharacterized protein LOC131626514 [Vicia villosa]|uniref:uncharacterized protein LOC131626514 n=1 Tax=Vicia villosa TaxID=3911 RepID=UPI00273C8520|nr:uncharacterized protein LOC131626514 [Vicia villosa]
MNPSSSSGNQDNDRKQKRKATAEQETKPKRVRITYDPLKVYQPLDGTPQSPPSSKTSTTSSSSFILSEPPSSPSDISSPSTLPSDISSSLSHPFPTRTPNPYSVVLPDSRFTVNPPTPTTQSYLELLHSDVNGWLEILGAAHLNHLDEYATNNLWNTFRQDFLAKATDTQRRIMSEAPGVRGLRLEVGESSHHHLTRNRSVLERKIPADELEEENLYRDIVVWRPWFPVLTGDFQWLFNWFRMNPSEKAPHMVFPVVVYRAEVAGPTPPTNLAAILQALEDGTSELPEPEYAKATSESDSYEEMEDAQAEDLPEDHPAEIAVPFGRNSGASSSGETSALMETLETLHQNQAMLASRLDAQEAANAEFRSFMTRQATSTDGIHDVLARILRRLGS